MATTSSRIYGPAQIATGPTTVYTVPSNTKAVLRQIHISNPSGSSVTFTLSIGADGATTRLFSTFTIPANSDPNSARDWFWYIPMTEGEILTLSAGTNNVLVIAISADLVTL